MKRIIQNTSELIITAADQYWWGSGWHSGYCCCQSLAAKYASVFVLHPQSTRGSHRYVRIALGHTDHSQETVRTFRASRQTNKMWLRQCCRRTSSCSIQAASTGVWRVSQLQPPACVCMCVGECVWAMYITLHIVHMQTAEWELYTICAAVWACGCSDRVHHSGKDNHKISDGNSVPRWNMHTRVACVLALCARVWAWLKWLSALWSLW